MSTLAQLSSNLSWVLPEISIRHLQNASSSVPSQSPPPIPQEGTHSSSRTTAAVLFVIVILAVIFFVSGFIHLLIRFLAKQRSRVPSSSRDNTRGDMSDSEAIQRQLQQLFHLHDSGLDQAFIDALPIFLYKELVGAKEPFDCAVCLCEFADDDKLRLLPICSHAFHLDCIDTWLLSNSTCPLCRGALFVAGLAIENPIYDFDDPREEVGVHGDMEEGGDTEKMVFSVRLGKFRSLQGANKVDGPDLRSTDRSIAKHNLRSEEGESSSSSLDRRCYSMGSYQYVVGDSVLRVALSTGGRRRANARGGGTVGAIDEGMEGRRLCVRGRGESFSVSKIWQWYGKRGKYPVPHDVASLDGSLASHGEETIDKEALYLEHLVLI